MQKKWKRVLVGSFDIASGLTALFFGFLIFSSFSAARQPALAVLVSMLMAVGFFIALGALAVLGGVCVLRRKAWRLSLAGSVAASFSLPFLGIPATLMLLLSPEAPRLARILVLAICGPLWLVYVGILVLVGVGYGV